MSPKRSTPLRTPSALTMTELRLATRASPLALAQSQWVAERLQAIFDDLRVSLVEVTTTGDADRESPVASLTEMGAFVRGVQAAVLDGSADAAVHSCKDLPTQGPDGLIAIFPERELPWDVLCGARLDDLPQGARIGTGSPRRAAQLRQLRSDLSIVEIRGNVETRLRAVEHGSVDAVVLAASGLRRLGIDYQPSQQFGIDEMVPAPAQAALAIEVRADSPAADIVRGLDHGPTRVCVEAERALLSATGAGCRSALGALAQVEMSLVRIDGFVEDELGPRRAWTADQDPIRAAAMLQDALGL